MYNKRNFHLIIGLLSMVLLMGVIGILGLIIGTKDLSLAQIWSAATASSSTIESNSLLKQTHSIIFDLRLPRTLMALIVGIALGAAGAITQSVTRNPLADPGLLGVNSGSAFAIAIAVGIFGTLPMASILPFALIGAFLATLLVYYISHKSSSGPMSPMRITLSGVALGAVLSGLTSAIVLVDPEKFNALRTWQVGSVADRGWDGIAIATPIVAIGLILSLALSKSLDAISMGDEIAASLGTNVNRSRTLAIVALTMLAGSATAMAGPLLFVGLMLPHIAKRIVGTNQFWITAYSAIMGATLVAGSDILGRILMRPAELPVGIVTAFLGAPMLIILVRAGNKVHA